jgi:MFS family permease
MLGVEAFPALLYTVLCFGIPKSPRWLIAYKGDREAGIKVLGMLRREATQSDLEAKADEIAHTARDKASTGGFWSWRLRFPILLAFLIAFFNQLSGINAVLYFAPRIFELTGLGKEAALLNSVGIGVTNLLFTFVGLYLIDRLGRRTLLYVGSVGYIVSLGLCAWAFFTYAPQFKVANAAISLSTTINKLEAAKALPTPNQQDIATLEAAFTTGKVNLVDAAGSEKYPGEPVTLAEDETTESALEIAAAALKDAAKYAGKGGLMVLVCIFAFIASHAVGQGAVIWVFISEIFPARHRGDGQALGCATHWVFAALITTVFPAAIAAFAPGYVFLFFSGMMVLQLIWVKAMVPETKGVSLEQMQQTLKVD